MLALDVEEASDIRELGFACDSGFLLLVLPNVSDSALPLLSASASSGRWLSFWVVPSFMMAFAVVFSFSVRLKSILRGV